MEKRSSMSAKTNLNPYLLQQIQTANPEKLILILYDIGIRSCGTVDRDMAAKAVVELISALNFDHKEVSMSYYSLYRYVLERINQFNFDDASLVLKELRDIWESIVMQKGPVPIAVG